MKRSAILRHLVLGPVIAVSGCARDPAPPPPPLAPAPVATAAAHERIAVHAAITLADEGTPISPWIYGIAMAETAFAKELNVSMRRMGGNVLSTWNWKTGFASSGSDWYFVNNPSDESKAVSGTDNWWASFLRESRAAGLEAYLTIPIMGRVAKDGTSCAFPIDKYPDQTSWEEKDHPGDHYRRAGTGLRVVRDADGRPRLDAQGRPIIEEIVPDPDDTSVAMPPEEQCRLLSYLKDDLGMGDAAHGGVRFIALDNEPALWNSTHRGMHPAPLSYDELWSRTETYASLLKSIDPTVQIAGYCAFGWTEYFFSALDADQVRQGKGTWDAPPDSAAHGGQPLGKWYLRQLAEHERATGVRLVDILDFHFYPQGGMGGPAHDAKAMEARVQETRVLWDPTWVDPSWMADKAGHLVRLIPMMREWIAECYPGTKTGIGEWNFSTTGDASDAVATVETLAVFAREGLDVACYWFAPARNDPTYWGFRLLRNPDGNCTAVGDRYLRAACDAPNDVSVHVYRDSASGRTSIVLANKRGGASAEVTLAFDRPLKEQDAACWEFDDRDCKALRALPAQHIAGNTAHVTLEPISVLRVDLDP